MVTSQIACTLLRDTGPLVCTCQTEWDEWQRLQLRHPEDDRYAAEIEKSIYSVAITNQDGGESLRYHAIPEGKKGKATHENTFCEGQGTRQLVSLPDISVHSAGWILCSTL